MGFQWEVVLPIRPHLLKMIARTKDIAPFRIVMGKCHYSTIIYNSLLKTVIRVRPTTQNYKGKMNIVIPSDLAQENRFTFDARTLNQIDKTLASIFEEKLVFYLDDNCFDKGDIKKYIQKFMDNYSLSEDDIQYDTLKKIYYRNRRSRTVPDKRNFRTKTKKKKSVIIPMKMVNTDITQNIQQSLF